MNYNPIMSKKRKERDIAKLMTSNYSVKRLENNPNELIVEFFGPQNTIYENGFWKLRVYLPEEYPFKSPSIGFINKIYHPNIDFSSGSICLDVINQTWTPMYELLNIFDVFLPQLLSYPNPSDPLNVDAANLLNKNPEEYNLKVKKLIYEFALQDKNDFMIEEKDSFFIEKNGKKQNKESTDIESNDDDVLSKLSELSELSNTSGIMMEEELLSL